MNIYNEVVKFMNKFPGTLAFRLKKHSIIMEKHLNPDEEILYTFCGQKNTTSIGLPNTYVVTLTNKRLLFARKRLLFGYFFYAITPDMFNDLKVNSGIVWGRIIIDTVKELVYMSNLSKGSLDEIETRITQYMMEEKKNYENNPLK